MKNLTEIRWHGRGGQGAKTAALLLGDAAMSLGKHIQAFPEYGPERMGAPVASFNRISGDPITVHYGITEPDIVVVLDPTLIGKADVTHGLAENGILIVNTKDTPSKLRAQIALKGRKLFTVDASGISTETVGRDIPNTPMIGALVKASGILDFDLLITDLKKKLAKKFASKPEIIEGNLNAVKRAFEEVKGE